MIWQKNTEAQISFSIYTKLSKGFSTVSMEGDAICSTLRKCIKQRSNFRDWHNWWKKTQKGKVFQYENIDWDSMKLTFKKAKEVMKIWVMKHSHDTCRAKFWLYRWSNICHQGALDVSYVTKPWCTSGNVKPQKMGSNKKLM